MKILRNYILKDLFLNFVFSFLLFSLVMVMGNLWTISDLIIRKGVNPLDAFKIFLFFFPSILRYTIPLACLLGVLLTMGRLLVDNELIAINIAGVSLFKILNLFIIIGLIISLFIFVLYNKIIPDFQYNYRNQVKNIYSKNISALIEPGVFLENFKNYIIYISDMKENKLKNIFIYETNEQEKSSKIIFAKKGEFVVEQNILKLKLEEGFRDETNPKNKDELYRLNFKIFFIDIPIKEEGLTKIKKKSSDMSLKELKTELKNLGNLGINPIEIKAELHERLNFSFSPIVFMILGFGTSLWVKHREKSINFGIAFLVAGFYYLLFILGKTLIEYRLTSPSLGMWIPNIVMGLIGVLLVYKNAHFR